MNELVALIVKKTKISEVMAVMIVNIVVDYISKKLPAPFGTQVKALLENQALMEGAGDLLEGLAAATAKKKTTKKKG